MIENLDLSISRVVVNTHKPLVVKPCPDLMCDSYSSVWMEVGLPHHKKFLVAQTYREWQLPNQRGDKSSHSVQEQLNRWTVFLDQWEKALNTGLEVHVLGDMNLNHCNWMNQNLPSTNQSYKLKSLIQALFSRILPQGVSQLVRGPTKHCTGHESLGLDLYFTNRPEKMSGIQTQYIGSSDHMLIFGTRYSRVIRTSPRYIRKRCYKNFNKEAFIAAVQQLSWLELYLETDVNVAVKLLSDKLTFILAPIRTIQVRSKYNAWISGATMDLIKERNALQKKAATSRDRDHWREFKRARNRVNNRLKFEEKNWQRLKIEECGENSGKVWSNVKGILNWKSSGSPTQLFHNGTLVKKPQDIAEAQNSYCITKIDQIRNNLPNAAINPLEKLESLMENRSCKFSIKPVHPDEVEKVILKLTNSNSFGMDLIDTYTIKLVAPEILPAITHIINSSRFKMG